MGEIDELQEATIKLTEHMREVAEAGEQELRIKSGRIVSGILWIPPFVGPPALYRAPRKPKPQTCVCPVCYRKHRVKK